jgi:hypothetical protein
MKPKPYHDRLLELECDVVVLNLKITELQRLLGLNNAEPNNQILAEREPIYRLPVRDEVITKIQSRRDLTPQQKVQLAQQFKAAQMNKARERNAIKNAASLMSHDELALQFINRNEPADSKYRIVPDLITS